MKKNFRILSVLILVSFCLYSSSYSQHKEIVLVNGNPPLTQLMVGKTIVLLDWILDLRLTKDDEIKINHILVNAWKNNNRAQIKSTTDIIELYEQVFKLNTTEQNTLKEKMRPLILESLYKEPVDELSALVISAYESSHSSGTKKMSRDTSSMTKTQNNQRVGSDGFTGIYRMMRPKALNMNSSGYERGFYVEHITFLPNGNLYWDLPPEGLHNFDFAVAQRTYPNKCGLYEFKKDEIHILRGPNKTKYIITRNGDRLNNPPSLGKGTFRLVPPADGLRLEGNYRRNQNEPGISFTRDGQFKDGGIFRFFGSISRLDGSTYMDDGIGGPGTYLIEQNTLELRYSDGRIKRFAFEAFPESLNKKPAVESFLLYEQRLERY